MESVQTKKEDSETRVISNANSGSRNSQTPVLFVKEEKNKLSPDEEEDKLLEESTIDASGSELAVVKLKLVETNITKLKTTDTTRADQLAFTKTYELKEYKIEHQFKIDVADVPYSNTFKSNYIKEYNTIEIALSFNPLLPIPSFNCIHKLLLHEVKTTKEKQKDLPFLYESSDALNFFFAACAIEHEDVATKILEESLYKTISFEEFIKIMLTVFENSLKELSVKLYKKFRAYLLTYYDITEFNDELITQLKTNPGEWELSISENIFSCIRKGKTMIAFSSDIFKKVFERCSKSSNELYLKPQLQYNLCKVERKKTIEGEYDEEAYPHHYYFKKENTFDPLLQAVRLTQHGKFLIFSKRTDNLTIYDEHYVGSVEPNYWGTAFEIFDNGFDETVVSKLPKYLVVPRRRLASILYETNIMGEQPRYFSVNFWNFLENKEDVLKNVKPHYDQKKECYTLSFYGYLLQTIAYIEITADIIIRKAKMASARNFHLIYPDDPDSLILIHGKDAADEFNLVYRHPLNMIQAFGVSLISIGKKFCVA